MSVYFIISGSDGSIGRIGTIKSDDLTGIAHNFGYTEEVTGYGCYAWRDPASGNIFGVSDPISNSAAFADGMRLAAQVIELTRQAGAELAAAE